MKEFKIFIVFVMLLFSIFLYGESKVSIDLFIISVCSLIFLVEFVILEGSNIRKGNYLSFNSIFSFVFFFASYVLAFFVSQSEMLSQYMNMTSSQIKYVDFNYITKGISLSTIAYSMYTIGYLWLTKKSNCIKYDGIENNYRFQKLSYGLLWFFFFLSLLNIGYSILSPREGGRVMFMDRSFIYEYFRVFLVLTLFAKRSNLLISGKKSFWHFWKVYKEPLLMSSVIVSLFLFFGERGESIMIFLIILGFIYFYFRRIGLKRILLLGLLGLFVLYGLRLTRWTESSISSGGISSFVSITSESVSEASPLFLFSDIIGTSHELCFGLEITERKGLTHPEQVILLPFYPIPFMPSVMSNAILGIPLKELSPITSLNDEMLDIAGQSCFGTHIVIDIYMRWGLWGILLSFFIFGIVISFYERNKYANVVYSACFLMLFAYSLYLPRGTMLSLIREITNIYILVYLFSISHRKRKSIIVRKKS